MDKTDLCLILNTLSLAVALGAGRTAAAVLAAFTAGLLIAKTTRPRRERAVESII
jgi:hypothetical protein